MKDRVTGRVTAHPIQSADSDTLQDFVTDCTIKGGTIYSDDARAYRGMRDREHEAVRHSVGEYVRDKAHTNGIESHWAMMKRGFNGIYHKMSPKHLDRYTQEFAGRHNARESDTIDQMSGIVAGMTDKRLRYRELIADNGLDNGARDTAH